MLTALALAFSVAASATEPSYQNYSALNYDIPGTPPPTIDATNFANYNQFNVTFENISVNAQFYEPMNVINYTNFSSGINTGIMTANSPLLTNAEFQGFGFAYNSVGVGFQFDTQTTNTLNHRMAGSFYNSGDIRCDSVLDGNNLDGGAFSLGNVGQCLVWATNISCPGTIDTSLNGFISMTGSNVDLTDALLTEEQQFSQGISPSNVEIYAQSSAEGFNFSGLWNPYTDLTLTAATSSPPDNLVLSNATPYVNYEVFFTSSSTTVVVQVLYLMNVNPNTPASVYMGSPNTFPNFSQATVQWTGTYTDPLTGLNETNYLYLYHNYFAGTNMPPNLGIGAPQANFFNPAYFANYINFLWAQQSPYSALGPPTAPGFPAGITFNDNNEFAPYEYFNGNLSASTVNTNAGTTNPNGSLTNLPARIQITASGDLKLANAIISGQNYLSLTATNRYDGSPGALIYSPYSDINLGIAGIPNQFTNSLSISNLLVSQIPMWGGTLNEWSTEWSNIDFFGIQWEYQVSLVYADLTPTIQPQVQNLNLTSTNLIISDVLNVFGSMSANAQNLTLTTNYPGSGATSPDGELNMQLENPLTWSWNGSFPNLLCLTNDGAIRMPNYSDFVASSPVTNITPTIPAIQAAATLSDPGPSNNIAAGGTVTIGTTTYDFVKTLTNTLPYQVKVGANFNGSMSNLIAAINQGPGSGTIYSSVTYASSVAVAGQLNMTNRSVVISANSANYPGTYGNNIPVSTTVTNLVWNGAVLAGGVDEVPGSTNITSVSGPYCAIINNGYISDQGSTIWVTNFLNGGVISNGPGSFLLTSFTATLTNGSITAGGDVSLTGNTIVASNVMIQAGRSLVLQATNLLSDGSVSNGNVWVVGSTNGTGGNGLILPFLPVDASAPQLNNLLGTTISVVTPPPNKTVSSTWAGLDYGGTTTLGYNTNNEAIGQLILTSLSPKSFLYFSGPAGSTNNNAIYVDRLVLQNYASLADREGSGGIPTLVFNSNVGAGNLTIYYADAVSSSTVYGGSLVDVSYILNGLNGGHLVWVPEYTGYFSATNVIYPDGSTNRLNIGLVTSPFLDSNGSGTPNVSDPDPIFVRSQVNFQDLGNVNGSNELIWNSPPGATNYLLNCTSNFSNWNIVPVLTNSAVVPPPGGWPITNVLYVPTNSSSYRIKIIQDNAILFGQ